MISRCPSCGAPAPEEFRQCRACGWDFVTNKKGEKKAVPPAKAEPEKPKAPPAPGLALPPARGGTADVPAAGLGMARLAKVDSSAPAPVVPPDENPFALPVARNLGPKPGDSLFSAAPPAVEAKLPSAKPKEDAAREEPAEVKRVNELPAAEKPPREEPPKKASPKPEPKAVVSPKREAPMPAPEPEPVEEEADASQPALFLPSSTKEIVVEPQAKRAPAEAPLAAPAPKAPEEAPVAAKSKAAAERAPETAQPKKAGGRPSAVYLAALAGGALGLLGVVAGFMAMRTDPQNAARPAGASPFGKRASGEAVLKPSLVEPAPAPMPAPVSAPAPVVQSESPEPVSIPAPAQSRPIEPPKPVAAAPLPAPLPAPAPPPPPVTAAPAARPLPSPAILSAPTPPVAAPPAEAPGSRPTATFAQTPRAKTLSASAAKAKAKAAAAAAAAPAAAKKPTGPQWIFDGVVYDLLTTRGVYGVKLVFVDAEDNEVAAIESKEGGRYHAEMKPGPEGGYALRIVHDDYSGKHIDELDSTSSVRKADLEQRKFLMQAGARSLPWIGSPGKLVHRDMALVPKVPEE